MLLQLQNVSFGFSPQKEIFTDLFLNIEQGKVYALMGINGSGKTTLLNLITGFHKLKSGKILFKDRNITNNAPYRICRLGISRTFQDLRLISKLTVRENILLAMNNDPTEIWAKALLPPFVFKNNRHESGIIADKIIGDYFLKDIQHSLANEISFGQQKLLNLACCVANKADLILLDEPVAGISPQYRDQITSLIIQLKKKGRTILMIEHNIDFIVETADLFLFQSEGRISVFDTLIQLQNSQRSTNAYF